MALRTTFKVWISTSTLCPPAHLLCVILSAQPGCPQLQASSVVPFAAWQYGLQYFSSPVTVQLQAG